MMDYSCVCTLRFCNVLCTKEKYYRYWNEMKMSIVRFVSNSKLLVKLPVLSVYRDAIMINIVSFFTSLYAGFAVFSIIGFMANEAGIEVDKVIDSGIN